MTCHDYEKWLSDSLDGVLGDDQRAQLERHLGGCPSCRAYCRRLERLQQQAGGLRTARVAPSYWDELSAAVRGRIESSGQGRRHVRPIWWNWRWASGAAVLLAAAVCILLLRPGSIPAWQSDVFTFEACLGRLGQEIGDDAELAGNFNRVLLSSLREDLAAATLEDSPLFSEDPLLWEGLSEDEWEILEQELKKALTS